MSSWRPNRPLQWWCAPRWRYAKVPPLASVASSLRAMSPLGWFDSRSSLTWPLGVQWLVRSLHSRLFTEPLGPGAEDFRTRCLHTHTDAQVHALLEQAGIA